MSTETRTYTLTASPDVLRRVERFLALLHYNAGHSAIFGLQFDGDGRDRLAVDPPPDPALALPAQRIGRALDGLEYVGSDDLYRARAVAGNVVYLYREIPAKGIDLLLRKRAGEPHGEVVEEWPRTGPTESAGSSRSYSEVAPR